MKKLRWSLLPFVTALLVLAVACGGDSDDDDEATTGSAGGTTTGAVSTGASGAGGSTTGAAAPTQAPAAATAAPAPTTAPQAGAPAGTLDLTNLSATLAGIESFRFDLTLAMDFDVPEGQGDDAAAAAMLAALFGNIKAEGAYVSPDSFEMSMNFLGMDFKAIQIGTQSWVNDGTGWTVDTGEMSMFGGTSPAELPFEFIPAEVLEGAETSTETVNGIEATRYSFDKESLAALAEATGETTGLDDIDDIDTLTMDVWITEDGLPVKMTMDMQGESEGSDVSVKMEYNVRDINDSGISIEPPL